MAISGINTYATTAQGSSSTQTSKSNSSSSISMDDFFTLLSAQMQNQTMFNPMQDTEFIGQMAQFSTVQQMQALSSSFTASLAVSFVGKYVKAEKVDDLGQAVQGEGIVEKVDFTGDNPMLLIDGNWFATSGISEVQNQMPVMNTVIDDSDVVTDDVSSASDPAV